MPENCWSIKLFSCFSCLLVLFFCTVEEVLFLILKLIRPENAKVSRGKHPMICLSFCFFNSHPNQVKPRQLFLAYYLVIKINLLGSWCLRKNPSMTFQWESRNLHLIFQKTPSISSALVFFLLVIGFIWPPWRYLLPKEKKETTRLIRNRSIEQKGVGGIKSHI